MCVGVCVDVCVGVCICMCVNPNLDNVFNMDFWKIFEGTDYHNTITLFL